MSKEKFLNSLKKGLKKFSKEEVDRVINYYDEIISEKVEQGGSEEKIIKELGDIKDIIKEIQLELVTTRINEPNNNLHKISTTFFIILMLFASPALLPIGIALFVIFFTVIIISAILMFSFGASTVGLIISIIPSIIALSSSPSHAVIAVGVILALIGVFGLLTILFLYLTRWILTGIAKLSMAIAKRFNKKEV